MDGRIVNTTSGAGLLGSIGQGAYSAAKAGIAALTLVEAAELGRYGVTANADRAGGPHPDDRGGVRRDDGAPAEGEFDAMAPENIAPLVAWLVSEESRDVTGRVFEVEGGVLTVAEAGARRRPSTTAPAGTRPSSARPSGTFSPGRT